MQGQKGNFGNRLINLLAVLLLLALIYALGRFIIIPAGGFLWTQTIAAARTAYGQFQSGLQLFMQWDTALYCWLGLSLYLLPTLLACIRRHPRKFILLLFNVFFSWSVIGWILALIWVLSAQKSPQIQSH